MESISILKTLLILLFVIALIVGFALVARRVLLPRVFQNILPNAKFKQLKIIETMALDVRHRFVLLQWRDKQYLLLTSGTQPLLVDSQEALEEVHKMAGKNALKDHKKAH